MKTYLNADERSAIVILAVVHEKALAIMEKFQNNLTSKERQYLKTATTDIQKAMQMIFARLGNLEYQRVMQTAKHLEVSVMPKENAKMWKKRVTKEIKEEGCFVDFDTLYDLAEVTIGTSCTPCMYKTAEEREGCALKRLYLSLEIPVADEYAKNGDCPYDNKEV